MHTFENVQYTLRNSISFILELCFTFRGISHSALSDMKTIEQEGSKNSKLNLDNIERRNKSSFFEDELDMYSGGNGYSSGPPK